ncbi:TIGR03621 family F420-dependent LLM class oxidoreductase [Nocardia elegans]|uniref:TIGR03621 family F420-dependent LLM class oxidoreductase n=1 Tax=Nocardia elegans TaxID=300029 RepID=UPI001895DA3E|nr:TIGR03621 family F420-dependent LLM class oxidoreductase [Nocardia elegans]MBF6451128.1 TIGR03621 family F420-dependent LLM class oxidoreductase [Nocardia elegans]
MTLRHNEIKTALYAPPVDPDMRAWRQRLRRMDASNLTAVTVSDHFLTGRQDPLPALAAVAAATQRLRVMALVLANDYRHPVITHKAAATLDTISGGRFDLGLGAGFLAAEYSAAGMPYDAPGVRVDRLAEAIEIIQALFTEESVRYTGKHYTITDLPGSPAPIQRPHPPLVIGGGGPRMLRLAGRYAGVVGVHSNLRRGTAYDAGVIEDMLPEQMSRKIGWAREAAESAGRDPDSLDYLSITWTCRVVDRRADSPRALHEVCEQYRVDPDIGRRSTGLLVGTVDECVEQLRSRRDELGLNYVDFGAADFERIEPLLAALAS